MGRRLVMCLSAAALVTVLLPAPASAGTAPPDLSGFTPDFTQPIPFMGVGESAIVSGVEVTVTTNTAVRGDSANTYLHQANSRLRTVFTFDEPIPGFQATTRLHDDCLEVTGAPPDCFELYELVGRDSAGTVVFQKSIRQINKTYSFVPGDGPGKLSGLIATLEVDYSYDTPTADTLRGSYLDLALTDTYIEPASQSVRGSTGEAIEPSMAFDATGFAGAITYTVTEGKLPAGLRLDPSTGVISGKPTKTAFETVTITATGATRGTATATILVDITPPVDDGSGGGGSGGGGGRAVAPGAPTGVTAPAGDGSAAVSWVAPADDGGSPITGYSVRYSSDGGATWTVATMCSGPATTCTVTGLTNGTAYVFEVLASNAAGDSDWSAGAAPVTPVAATSTLPTTGADTLLALVGLAAVAAGVSAMAASRRRSTC